MHELFSVAQPLLQGSVSCGGWWNQGLAAQSSLEGSWCYFLHEKGKDVTLLSRLKPVLYFHTYKLWVICERTSDSTALWAGGATKDVCFEALSSLKHTTYLQVVWRNDSGLAFSCCDFVERYSFYEMYMFKIGYSFRKQLSIPFGFGMKGYRTLLITAILLSQSQTIQLHKW